MNIACIYKKNRVCDDKDDVLAALSVSFPMTIFISFLRSCVILLHLSSLLCLASYNILDNIVDS